MAQMRALRPKLEAVLVSAYAGAPSGRTLQKPFNAAQLAAANVNRVIVIVCERPADTIPGRLRQAWPKCARAAMEE